MFFESPFHGYPTCLTFDHVVWWSTALWTARTTRRRRPGRYLTLECITSVEIFFYKGVICSGKDGYSGIFYTFNMPNIPNHIKYMRFGCRRHRGRRGQQDGEDQGGGITSVEFFSNRTWYAVVVILVDKFFILSTCLTILSTCELVVDSTVDGKGNKEEKTREVANIRMFHFCRNFFQLGCDICGELVMALTRKLFFSFNDIWPY